MNSDPLITYRRLPATLKRRPIEKFAEVLRAQVARGREFHCLVTGDAELRKLNLRFRGKDAMTDVLSFPGLPEPRATGTNGLRAGAKIPLGDIAISLGRARTQAMECGHSSEDEICILMLHGVLHLLGMDHETDQGRMARAEIRWRRRLGLPAGLIERARESGRS
jgi:probable rRNA maturation factor